MNKQAQNRYKNLCSLTTNFREHQLKNGVNYAKRSKVAEKNLTAWIKEKCPNANEFEIEELICEIVVEKEDELLTIFADLEAISIDANKLPEMEEIVSPSQVNIFDYQKN